MTNSNQDQIGVFAPYMKHYGKTEQEQLEKNQPLMEWLKQKIEAGKNLTEDEMKQNSEYLENFKQTIDSFRPNGHKLYQQE